jgi:hypothetical protein
VASIPPAGPLHDWLRQEAALPFEEPRGDVGDALPLQWLTRLFVEKPGEVSRLAFAVEGLLGEGDIEVSRRLLDVLPEAPAAYRSAVARAVGNHRQVLAGVSIPSAGKTLLGAAVESLRQDRLAEPLSDQTLTALESIDRPEDGWPASLAIGLWADYSRFSPALVAALGKMSEPVLERFILDVMSWVGEPTTTEGFERVGREADAPLRGKVGGAVKRQIDELAASRRMMEQLGVKLPPQAPPDQRWADAARRLGVPA